MSKIEDIFPGVKTLPHPRYTFLNLYELDGNYFIIEPIFKVQYKRVSDRYKNEINEINEAMLNKIKELKKVIFTGNFEEPLVDEEGYYYVEIDDILCELNLPVEDKSRGCDYGD